MHSSVEVLNTFTHSPEAHNRNLHPQNTHINQSVISDDTRPSVTFRKKDRIVKQALQRQRKHQEGPACNANANC